MLYHMALTLGPVSKQRAGQVAGMSPPRMDAAAAELRLAGLLPDAAGPRQVSTESIGPVLPPRTAMPLLRERQRAVDQAERIRRQLLHATGLDLPQEMAPARMRARHLRDEPAVRRRIAELVTLERHEHLSLSPERAFAPPVVATALPLDRQLQARGVRVRMCGVPAVPDYAHSPQAHQLGALRNPSRQYRERDQVPLKLMIFDRVVALFPINPLDFSAGALEIHEPAVVDSLITLFQQHWDTASAPEPAPPIASLTERERNIVGLLARGHTDDTTARELGLSPRTVSYALRGLMERLGVTNRFQLGLVLGLTAVHTQPATAPKEDT
jgi:DNA-binding CsgD family transcriptional regulator